MFIPPIREKEPLSGLSFFVDNFSIGSFGIINIDLYFCDTEKLDQNYRKFHNSQILFSRLFLSGFFRKQVLDLQGRANAMRRVLK